MPYLIVVLAVLVTGWVIYLMGRRSGYQAGRLDERKEWSTRIRQIDKEK